MGIENKFMVGSAGNADYLVIAEKDGYRLGVKGISSNGPNGTVLLGMRIRTQRKDGQPTETPKDYGETWPLPFEQFNEFRASYEVIQFINLSVFQIERITSGGDNTLLFDGAWNYFKNNNIKLDVKREQFYPVMSKNWFDDYDELVNHDELKYLLSDYTSGSKVMKNLQDKIIDITQDGILFKGDIAVWPPITKQTVDKPKKKKKTRKKVQGAKGKSKEATTNNVVPIKPKK